MNDSIQQAARRILATMRQAHSGEYTYLPVDEADFRHLDLAAYRDFRTQHEAQGFRHLRDVEIAEITAAPRTLIARTYIRSMVSADGGTVAGYYQVKPRVGRLTGMLLRGLGNGRWIDAPRFFFRTLKTKHCTSYESELSNGHYVTTSNAESAARISLPPTIDSEFHPYGTSPAVLVDRHAGRLKAHIASATDAHPCFVRNAEELEQMQRRLKRQKDAYRASMNWVTQAELEKMAPGHPQLAAAVFEEVRRQLSTGG